MDPLGTGSPHLSHLPKVRMWAREGTGLAAAGRTKEQRQLQAPMEKLLLSCQSLRKRKGRRETLSVLCLTRVASVGGKSVGDLLHLEPAFAAVVV